MLAFEQPSLQHQFSTTNHTFSSKWPTFPIATLRFITDIPSSAAHMTCCTPRGLSGQRLAHSQGHRIFILHPAACEPFFFANNCLEATTTPSTTPFPQFDWSWARQHNLLPPYSASALPHPCPCHYCATTPRHHPLPGTRQLLGCSQPVRPFQLHQGVPVTCKAPRTRQVGETPGVRMSLRRHLHTLRCLEPSCEGT